MSSCCVPTLAAQIATTRRPALYLPTAPASWLTAASYVAAFNGVSPLTVEGWFLATDCSITVPDHYYIRNQATSAFGYSLYNTNTQILELTWGNGTVSGFANAGTKDGVWYHFAATWSGASTAIKIWLNGVNTVTTAVTTIASDTGNPLIRFGSDTDLGAPYGTIAMQDVRISNVVRYSATFAPPAAPFLVDANTVGLWPCNEGAGNTVHDQGTNLNHLTMKSTGAVSLPFWGPGRL